MILKNLQELEQNIKKACENAGRKREEITLVAVSKTQPVSLIREVYDAGIREFGENKVQELTEKYEILEKDIAWHMIGHLQRNKVKYILDKAILIHSVDSVRLAEEISRQAAKRNLTVSILLEVNIAREETKFGFFADTFEDIVLQIAKLSNISIKGLMTSAPYVTDPEENRKYFKQLKQLYVDINNKNIDNVNMDVLSMGMTNDYITAIEEGATHIRVGTAVFGQRNYN